MKKTYIAKLDQRIVSGFRHFLRDLDQGQDLQDEQDYRSNSQNDSPTDLVNPVNPVLVLLKQPATDYY